MAFFAFSVTAIKVFPNGRIEYENGLGIVDSPDEENAKNWALLQCQKMHPTDKGYSYHKSKVCKVPDKEKKSAEMADYDNEDIAPDISGGGSIQAK